VVASERGRRTMRIGERRLRRGAALLEALVALVVLTTAGAAITALAVMTGDVSHRAHSAEGELRRADAFFGMVSLWPREDLDRHLGDHEQGPWQGLARRPRVVVDGSLSAGAAP